MHILITDEPNYNLDPTTQKIMGNLEQLFSSEDTKIYYQYPVFQARGNFTPTWVVFDKIYGIIIIKISQEQKGLIDIINDNIIIEGEGVTKINGFLDYNFLLKKELDRIKLNNDKFPNTDNLNIQNLFVLPYYKSKKESFEKKNIRFIFGDINKFDLKKNKKEISKHELRQISSIGQKFDFEDNKIEQSITSKKIGDILLLNEQKIKCFDEEQEQGAIIIADSGTQIKGLAGTGKTIILAWKAAFIHFKHPDKKVLYTFFTKSLYNQIRRLIEEYYNRLSEGRKQPNWENLNILHAWGGETKEGVYYNICRENNIIPITMQGRIHETNPFGNACKECILKNLVQKYDFVLIDEAQDLPIEFFHLVEKITKFPKRITITYDELQNTNQLSLPEFEKLLPNTELKPKNNITLKKSYRNHIATLNYAISIGLGLYDPNGLIQILPTKEMWENIGYNLIEGDFKEGSNIVVERPIENSPNKLLTQYNISSIKTNLVPNRNEEIDFVAKEICFLIKEEKVKPIDIIVINLDNTTVKTVFVQLQDKLNEQGIKSSIPGIINDADAFFIEDHVTLSTIRRSKGNESQIVFVMGIDCLYKNHNNKIDVRRKRSFAFVSITRAKAICYLSGIYNKLIDDELKKIEETLPKLNFKFPTQKELDEMKKIDYSTKSDQEYVDIIKSLDKLIKNTDKYYIPDYIKSGLKKL